MNLNAIKSTENINKLQEFVISDNDGCKINDLVFRLFRNMKELVIYAIKDDLLQNSGWQGRFSLLHLLDSVKKYFSNDKLRITIYGSHEYNAFYARYERSWLFGQYKQLKSYINMKRFSNNFNAELKERDKSLVHDYDLICNFTDVDILNIIYDS